jgi:hypothetical protein
MTVGEFQQLLVELGRFLRYSKSPTVAKELEDLSAKLATFKDYKLKPFAELLVKAEEYARLGPPAKAPRAPRAAGKAKADPATVDQACMAVLTLYNRAIDPSVTVDQVEAAFQALQIVDAPTAKLSDLAKKMGIGQKFKNKDDILKAMRQKIISVKGTWDRKDA